MPDWAAIAALAEAGDAMGLCVFARSADPVYHLAVRAWVGATGHFEDVASGAANATLAAWLAGRDALPGTSRPSSCTGTPVRDCSQRSSQRCALSSSWAISSGRITSVPEGMRGRAGVLQGLVERALRGADVARHQQDVAHVSGPSGGGRG